MFTITKAGSTTLDVHNNDDFGSSSADPNTMEVTVQPQRGEAAVSGRNLRYTPDEGETTGADSIVYRICATDGSCDTATVSLTLDIS